MRSATDEGMAIVPRLPISGRRDRTNTSFEDRDSGLWHFSDALNPPPKVGYEGSSGRGLDILKSSQMTLT